MAWRCWRRSWGPLGCARGSSAQDKPAAAASHLAKATFAGGCFWCMEPPFDKLTGVVSTTSGYIGGGTLDPTYEEVSAGGTGHAEAVEVVYDPAKVDLREAARRLLAQRGPDRTRTASSATSASQYRTAIFYHDETQKRLAEQSKAALETSKPFKEPIVTEIVPAGRFYPAEEYHQDYYKKNPVRYKFYRYNCGRDRRLEQLWGKADAH